MRIFMMVLLRGAICQTADRTNIVDVGAIATGRADIGNPAAAAFATRERLSRLPFGSKFCTSRPKIMPRLFMAVINPTEKLKPLANPRPLLCVSRGVRTQG
jgi:hypothetical protein